MSTPPSQPSSPRASSAICMDDAAYVLERTRTCHGFYGASSMERLPTEEALTARTREFTQIRPSALRPDRKES